MASDGYDAVIRIADDDGEWLWTIRACFDSIARNEALGEGVVWTDEKWIEMSTGQRPRKLAPLVGLGVLVEKVWYDAAGRELARSRRVYYEMPDREGVGRALDELNVQPTVFL